MSILIFLLLFLSNFSISISMASETEGRELSAEQREGVNRDKKQLEDKKGELEDQERQNEEALAETTDEGEKRRLEDEGERIEDAKKKIDAILEDFGVLGGERTKENEAAYDAALKKYESDKKAVKGIIQSEIDKSTDQPVDQADYAFVEMPTYVRGGVRKAYNSVRAWTTEQRARLLELFNKRDSAIRVRKELQDILARIGNLPKAEANVDRLTQLYELQARRSLDILSVMSGTGKKISDGGLQVVDKAVAKLFTDAMRYRTQLERTSEYFANNEMLTADLKNKMDAVVKALDNSIDIYKGEFFPKEEKDTPYNDALWAKWQKMVSAEPSDELKNYLNEYSKFFGTGNYRKGQVARLTSSFGKLLNAKSVEELNKAMELLSSDYDRIDVMVNPDIIVSPVIQVREYQVDRYIETLEGLAEVLNTFALSIRIGVSAPDNIDHAEFNKWRNGDQDVPQLVRELYEISEMQDKKKREEALAAKAEDLDKLADAYRLMIASAKKKK